MTLSWKWGEHGKVNPINCLDGKKTPADISYADPTKTQVYILSENKTKLLMTISSTDFSISSPNINWTPTKVQSETIAPGNYQGEAHVKNTAESINEIFEFPVFVEKAKGNIT